MCSAVLENAYDVASAVTPVRLGELHESGVEVHSGLEEGDHVVGRGAILLKPIIGEALRLR